MSQSGSEQGPDEGTAVRADIARLNEQIDTLRTALADRFDAISAPDLAPLHERLAQLGGQIAAQPDVAPLLSQAVGPLASLIDRLLESDAAMRGDLALVTEVLAELTHLAEAGDEHVRGLVIGLTSRAERAEELGREAADAQALSLARVTAATDALATSLGALRSSLTVAVDTGAKATVGAIDDRLTARLADAAARLEAGVATQIREHIGDLGISQLRVSVAELTHQVVESRSDDRVLRGQIDALPVPDLSPVASQLARLSATIISQGRYELATSTDVGRLGQSLDDAMQVVALQLNRQAEATMEVWAHLAKQPSSAERTDDLRHEVGRATAGLQAAVERMEVEVAATRDAVERRPAPRWRRTGEDDRPTRPALAAPSGPSELELRVDGALSAMDRRLGSLAAMVERAITPAQKAAVKKAPLKAAVKKAPVKKAPVKRAPVKKAPVKKAAVKKAPVKKTGGGQRSASSSSASSRSSTASAVAAASSLPSSRATRRRSNT